MTLRSILAAFALGIAALAIPGAASAQTVTNCSGRVQATEITFASQGGGYGVVIIRYSVRVRNTSNAAINAVVSLGAGLPSGFTAQPSATRSLPAGTSEVPVGSFTGTSGSSPPSTADVLRRVQVRCVA
ncbi:hypothetical protein ACE7GA_15265 [Roseomonas sp. CCTCC AB2023176]|uniref:hypothetical protein n=1 Tax=Roseomonas sp. CCTCC AB2023176 TaxID=3342640 RepID=UPI0035E12599